MGGLFRTAAAFGVDHLLFGDDCCDPLYRKSVRISIRSDSVTSLLKSPPSFNSFFCSCGMHHLHKSPCTFYTVGKKRRTATGQLCDTIHQNGREIRDKYCRHVAYPDLQIASRESVFNPHPRLQERTLKSFKQYLNECYP